MDSKTIRYNNARALVRKMGSVSAFAEAINKGQSQVSQFAGENPVKGIGAKIAREIEAAFSLSPGWLDVAHATADTSPEVIGMSAWDRETPLGPDEVNVPFYKEVEMAAGNGLAQCVEINGEKLRFSKAALQQLGVDPANAVCATLRGTSQEPMIRDGSTIGIDRGRTQIKDGALYAIDHDGMFRVKFLYRMPGGGLRLRSTNSAEHPEEPLDQQAASKIKVLGWVFWWSTLNKW